MGNQQVRFVIFITNKLNKEVLYKMGKRITEKEILEYANSVKEYKFIKLLSYEGVSSRMQFYCEKHDYIFDISYRHMAKRGQGCPRCAQDKRSKSITKWSEKQIRKYIEDNTDLKLLDIIVLGGRKDTVIKTLCEHGHECEVRFETILSSKKCKECNIRRGNIWIEEQPKGDNPSKKKIWNKETIKEMVENAEYELIDILENRRIVVKCNHGHEPYETGISNFNKGYRCKKCANEKLSTLKRYSIEKIRSEIEKEGYKLLSKEYKNNTIKLDMCCDKGHEFKMTYNAFQRGERCPHCQTSKGEKKIKEYLDNNSIEYIQQYRFEDCRNKKPLPFDFYLPEYNMCIEYDGEQHFSENRAFGGTDRFWTTVIHDAIKNQYCEDNNINILRIPFWELKNIEEILKKEIK